MDDEGRPKGGRRLREGCTSLMYHCQQGLTSKVIREIKSKPETLWKRDRHNKSALHYCSQQRHLLAPASVMINAPELMEAADEDGFTPLHLAVIQGNTNLVNLLLGQDINVNALDNEGHSVVHWATVCGEIDALRSCLAAGAELMTPDNNGATPLHFAAQICGANYEGKSNRASQKLALEILRVLLEHPAVKVDAEDKDGRTPLLWAASAGSARAVQDLVKAGAKVESSDKDGLTALHCAASKGHIEVIDTLVNMCNCDVDLIDSNGCSALHYAVTLGHADATSMLLDLGADPNRSDRKGRTPAHCGCNKGQLETVKILGSRKANLWLRNAKGDLPIHEAAQSGRKELVQWLLEQKPMHVNTTSNDGKTLLHLAATNDSQELCKILIEYGADVNAIYRNHNNTVLTPLDVALQKGHRCTAKFLQLHSGLPANKVKITGKLRPAASVEEAQKATTAPPVQFAEKEELVDIKKSKRYVVYVKRADSVSDDEVRYRSSRSKGRCRHRHKRRSRSCSLAKKVVARHHSGSSSRRGHIVVEGGRSDSSPFSSDDEECCTDCCSGDDTATSRTKNHQIVCEYKRKRVKKRRGKCARHEDVRIQSNDSSKSDSETEQRSSSRDRGKKERGSAGGGKKKGDGGDQKPQPVCHTDHSKTQYLPSVGAIYGSSDGEKVSKRPRSAKRKTKSESSTDQERKEASLRVQQREEEGVASDSTYVIEKKTPSEQEAQKKQEQSQTTLAPPSSTWQQDQTQPPPSPSKVQVKTTDEKLAGTTVEFVMDQKQSEAPKSESKGEETPKKDQKPAKKDETPPKKDEKPPQKDSTEKKDTTTPSASRPGSRPGSPKPFKVMIEVKNGAAETPKSASKSEDSKQAQKSETKLESRPDVRQEVRQEPKPPQEPPKTDQEQTQKSAESSGPKLEQQSSKDQDSGIEPSPKSAKSRSSIRRRELNLNDRAFTTLSESFRVIDTEKRKPGDKNACDMTTVSKFTQRNVKRHYAEKQIFHALHELKNLKMRTNRSNEAILVKRSVDEYHKSIDPDGRKYPHREYSVALFENFLFETLKSLQKPGSHNFQNLADVYKEAERRTAELARTERALQCTTKTHRCLHAVHSYTGIPCAAYIPMMNHHTIPKLGFGPHKKTVSGGSFYLPKILTGNKHCRKNVALELSHGDKRQVIPLPTDKLDSRKRYYVTFDVDNQKSAAAETA